MGKEKIKFIEKFDSEASRKSLLKTLEYYEKSGLSWGLNLTPDSIKALTFFLDRHATKTHSLNHVLNEMLQEHYAYLKEDQF
jgi:hypothetical protein